MVTLTVRTSQHSPSPAFTIPTLASCSRFSTSNNSGITLVHFGIKGGHRYEGTSQGAGPKTSIMTEGTLHKGQLQLDNCLLLTPLKHSPYKLMREQYSTHLLTLQTINYLIYFFRIWCYVGN